MAVWRLGRLGGGLPSLRFSAICPAPPPEGGLVCRPPAKPRHPGRGAVDGPGRYRRMRHAGTDDTSGASPVEQADIAATRQLARYHHNPALRAVTAFSQLADQPPLLAAS